MPDLDLDERFSELRSTSARLTPVQDAAAARHRGQQRRTRQRVATSVVGLGLVAGALVGVNGMTGGSQTSMVAPATTSAPSVTSPPADQQPAPPTTPTTEPSVVPPPTTAPSATGSPSGSPTSSPTSVPPTAPTSDPGTGVAGAADVPANGRDFGYLTGSTTEGGVVRLSFDRATLLTGEEARVAREAAGQLYEEGVDGLSTFVRNDNPTVRSLPLADDVSVLGSSRLLGTGAGPEAVDVQTLLDLLSSSGEPLLVEIRYDADGFVQLVQEVYQP